jgi:hypothetical protein
MPIESSTGNLRANWKATHLFVNMRRPLLFGAHTRGAYMGNPGRYMPPVTVLDLREGPGRGGAVDN